jgi:hypothetical protein
VDQPPPDAIRRRDKVREELERCNVFTRKPIHLIGKRIRTARHVDPDSGDVEVGVTERECDTGADDPTTGVEHTPCQMRRGAHRPTGVTAENLDELLLPATETLPYLECLPFASWGDRRVTSIGSDFAVTEQVETH